MSDLTVKISHSKIKNFKACSLKYFYRYELKIPEPKHPMTELGTCIHTILECLVKTRHYKKYEKIILSKKVSKKSAIGRYIIKFLKAGGMDKNLYDYAVDLLVAGCEEDFFCNGAEEFVGAEIPFEIKNEDPPYYIVGYLDQLAKYKGNYYRIKDFKSGKPFGGEDDSHTSNPQALTYGLAVKKLYDANAKVVCDFIFLKNEKGERQFRVKIDDATLAGYEIYLGDAYQSIVNFTPKDRWSNIAIKQPYPPKGGGFTGPVQCGRSKFKGDKKEDGSIKFSCPVKWPFSYYGLFDKNGDQIKTSLDKKDLKISEKGQKIKKLEWGGCEFFNGGSRY